MTTVIKHFQPYEFQLCALQDDCGLRESNCWQVSDLNDTVAIQFANPTNTYGLDLIDNGDFSDWVLTGSVGLGEVTSWAGAGGGADWECASGPDTACSNDQSIYMFQEVTMNECECFRLLFDLLDTLAASCVLTIYGWDGANWDEITSYSGQAAANDLETLFCATDNWTRIAFRLSSVGECGEGICIDNVRLQKFETNVYIRTCDDVTVAQINDCDIDFYSTHWNVVFNWSDYNIEAGCYKICVDDINFIKNPSFEIYNSAFSFYENWTNSGVGTSWSAPTVGEVTIALNAGASSKLLLQYVDLPVCEYTLVWNIEVIANVQLDVYYNDIIIESFTGVGGTMSTTFTPIEEIESISFRVTNLLPASGIELDLYDVSLIEDICSKCVCVDDHACTLLLTGTQANDAADFYYDDDFTFHLRLRAELLDMIPEFDEVTHRESDGQSNLIFGDLRTGKDLMIYLQPVYIWNAITRLMIHKEFRIKGVEYIKKAGNIEIRWTDNFGEGTHTVIKKKQLQRN